MTTILCSIPNPADATSLYRGIGPFQSLRRRHAGIDLAINNDISWPVLKGVDIAFFQRPALDDKLNALKMCKLNNKKIWVDYDDNLHAIPLCNRRFVTYGHPHIQHNIATMVALADVVTASTDHLKDALAVLLKCFPDNGEFNLDPAKIITVPNAYDPEIHPSLDADPVPRAKRIMWRGSDSHAKDMYLFTQALGDIVERYPEYEFEFVGEPFWLTIETIRKRAKQNQVVCTAPMDPINFFKYMKKQAPALLIVPLEDIAFNRSKSNIAWIESTCAGTTVLAPNWAEWRKPGIIHYRDPEEFSSRVNDVLQNWDLNTHWRQSRDHIREHLNLRQVNEQRLAIVRKLAEQI